jgi:hypothetical protein
MREERKTSMKLSMLEHPVLNNKIMSVIGSENLKTPVKVKSLNTSSELDRKMRAGLQNRRKPHNDGDKNFDFVVMSQGSLVQPQANEKYEIIQYQIEE